MHEDERKSVERIIPKLRQSVVTETMSGTDTRLVDKLGDGASPQWIMELRALHRRLAEITALRR